MTLVPFQAGAPFALLAEPIAKPRQIFLAHVGRQHAYRTVVCRGRLERRVDWPHEACRASLTLLPLARIAQARPVGLRGREGRHDHTSVAVAVAVAMALERVRRGLHLRLERWPAVAEAEPESEGSIPASLRTDFATARANPRLCSIFTNGEQHLVSKRMSSKR